MALLGITDTLRPSFENYCAWVHRLAPDVELAPLSHERRNAADIRRCDGLLLTGGGDVHPKFYGEEHAMGLMEGVNLARDEFEFEVIHSALEMEIPILGICRGMQVFNVAAGGSLIPDVQAAGYGNHRKDESNGKEHAVAVEKGTMLHALVGEEAGFVNTHHHQAVDRCGDGLNVTARSTDGVVEAMEWEDGQRKPFLLLVQWHPERITEFHSPFSQAILRKFVGEVVRSTTMNTVHD